MSLVPGKLLVDWPAPERRALLGAAFALLGASMFVATVTPAVLPIQRGFGSGADGEMLLRQLPDVAALLVIPWIGAFGPQVPSVRLVVAAAIALAAGSVIMTVAPSLPVLAVGLSLGSAGRATVGVIAFAAVGASVTGERRRASAFALLGSMPAAAFIAGPPMAGWLIGQAGWRLAGVLWIASAALVAVAAPLVRADASPPTSNRRKEPWTPILAGVMLVGIVQWLGDCTLHGPLAALTLAWLAVAAAAGGTWFVLARRLPNPSLDGRTLNAKGLAPILLVAMIAQCGDLWFYVGALVHFLHRRSSFETALWLLPGQLAGLAGAWLAGRMIPRFGLARTGTFALAFFCVAMLTSCAVTISTPVWAPVAVLCMAAMGELGTGVCVAQAVMERAPKGLDRQVSSYRSAATGVGNVVTLMLVAASVRVTMTESMRERVEAQGVTPAEVDALVSAVQANRSIADVGRRIGLDDAQIEHALTMRRDVIIEGFHAHGVASAAVLAAAAVGFWAAQRRRG